MLGDIKKTTTTELKAVIGPRQNYFLSMIKSADILRFIKYCVSGGIGIIIDFSLFSAQILFTNNSYIISNIISFSLGTIVVCYLQKNWTFKYDSKDDMMLYVRYMIVILVTFLFNTVVLFILIRIVLIDPINSKTIQVTLSTFFNYVMQKHFVFRLTGDFLSKYRRYM
jgi:putative flippase GtrA